MGSRKSGSGRLSAAWLCVALAASAGQAWSSSDDVVVDPALAGLAPVSPTALYLRTGTIDTTAGRPGVAALAGQPGRWVIQLDGPMTPARRDALHAAGVWLGDYLPMNSWIVRLEGADAGALGALGFVRWWSAFDDAWKLAPEIGQRRFTTLERQALAGQGMSQFLVELFLDAELHATVQAVAAIPGVRVASVDWIGTHASLHVEAPTMAAGAIAKVAGVQFVEDFPEITLRNNTTRWILQTNITNDLKLYTNGLTGAGQVVGVIDDKINVNHCSFLDSVNPIGPNHRKILAYNTSLGSQFHGTHVAGTAAGDNGTNNDTRGMAYLAKIVYNTIPSFSETAIFLRLETHHNQTGRDHTNSWGNDGTTQYDGLCRGFDRFQHTYEDSQVYLAVTNTNTLKNPENAKNLLAVGASRDTPNQGQHCTGGTGPTSDGRRKPEIYAPGCSTNSSLNSSSCSTTTATGTSMASPAIAGMGALVRQYYADGYYPSGSPKPSDQITPSGALVKATLINGAVDMTGVSGYPSNQEGWGRLLADVALYFPGDVRTMLVRDVRNAVGLNTGQSEQVQFNITGAAEQLRVTLVWTDVAASAGASFAAINDLDLEVLSPGGTVYKGNVFSGGVSVPGGSKDDRNNVEQVHLNSPQSGVWTARVIGAGVQQGKQGYALVVTGQVAQELPLQVAFLNAPASLTPLTPFDLDVMVAPGTDTLIVDSPTLYYRAGAVGSFTSVPLVHQGGDVYRATLPGFPCGMVAEYYATAESVESGLVSEPDLGGYAPQQSIVGSVVALLTDFFEFNSGWTSGAPGDTATAGLWNRMTPQQTVNNGFVVQPGEDHTDGGVACWVTDGQAGANANSRDVDGGRTTLQSPSFNIAGYPYALVKYWRWYTNSRGNSPNQDAFTVQMSSDGAAWNTAEVVGPGGPIADGGWYQQMVSSRGLATPNGTISLRFIAEDLAPDSLVEALVDDFELFGFECEDESCPADFNGDTVVNTLDVLAFLNAYNSGDPSADFNGDTVLNTLDVLAFLNAYTAGCD
ncbi:MAG: S8 family serine peptidase [Phycisphaerales bacterium]|nr:S8 family serine peptidase [Phycisphaerales bacterium]